jgi:hypothetical protein
MMKNASDRLVEAVARQAFANQRELRVAAWATLIQD